MTTRKVAVRISSSVRTQAGGGGIAEDTGLFVLVMLLEADAPRDTSPGLGRCMRGMIVAEACWPGTGRQ